MAEYEDWQSPLEYDDAVAIIGKVINQVKIDYLNLDKSNDPRDLEAWKIARDFIFDDEYCVDWGGEEKTVEELLAIKGIELEYFRMKMRQKKAKIDRAWKEKIMIEDQDG